MVSNLFEFVEQNIIEIFSIKLNHLRKLDQLIRLELGLKLDV